MVYRLSIVTLACLSLGDLAVIVIKPDSPGLERTITKANPLKAFLV